MTPRSIPHTELTARDRGMVLTEKKRKLGAIIREGDGSWAAWNMSKKLGKFPTAEEAIAAVRSPPKPPKGKPWETRS